MLHYGSLSLVPVRMRINAVVIYKDVDQPLFLGNGSKLPGRKSAILRPSSGQVNRRTPD